MGDRLPDSYHLLRINGWKCVVKDCRDPHVAGSAHCRFHEAERNVRGYANSRGRM